MYILYKKISKVFYRIACIAVPALFLTTCNAIKTHSHKYKIGISQCGGSDKWRQSMLQEIKRELSFHSNVEYIYKDANDVSAMQVQQIKELLKEKIDILLVSPNEAQPLTPVIEEVYNKGIPVIVFDRKIASHNYTAYIGANNYEIGKLAGEYAAQLLHNNGRIIEVLGLPGSTPAVERHQGFVDALNSYPEVKITQQIYGEWLKDKANSELAKAFAGKPLQADLVFAHNDMMALGAYNYCRQTGQADNLKFIGVDGLAVPGGGLQMVSDKILTATMLYPTVGEESIKTALAILEHQSFKKENLLQTLVIDSTNVRLMQLQANKISSQQADIERQQNRIEQQQKIYKNQSMALNIILGALLGVIVLGVITFLALRNNRKMNKRLQQKNNEIIQQQLQLIEMQVKAEEAHDTRLNFFTKLSHEFRTPLTLILAPLEELTANAKINFTIKKQLLLIQKNAVYLLRLVDQLMDFRKIELQKIKLKATETDLIAFVADITTSFKPIADKKNIDLRLITKENTLLVWFDSNMIEKVIFNLLSNAFKFTSANGFIYVTIEKNATDNFAILKVEDNGIGINAETQQHAFDLFYQDGSVNQLGAGLGLSLSKEFVTLHHGLITATGAIGKGSCFEVRLPLGLQHFKEEEIYTEASAKKLSYAGQMIFNDDTYTENSADESNTPATTDDDKQTILIVEDNQDLNDYLCQQFQNNFEVIKASDGLQGLQMAFDNIPDIIICDIMMPGKNGFEVSKILKTDIKTSHIPIILLTAKNAIDDKIKGMQQLADAYLAKPFNTQFLQEKVKSLLLNRAILREHYVSDLPITQKKLMPCKLDKKFINEFTSLVENNIANENFNIDEICKHMGVSRVQLYRKIKALLDCNVNDYILSARIQKAKYFLKHEDLSISEIAYKSGFASPAYFSTVFKSRSGVTPKEYRGK